MSLNVYLNRKRWVSYDEGKTNEIDYEQMYEANITHNLGKMTVEAGIYKALWRPEEIEAVYAKDIIGIIGQRMALDQNKYLRFGYKQDTISSTRFKILSQVNLKKLFGVT